MYVHTGTVHVVQERMDILPYMCVPYTGVVRWGGWGAGGENQKKWYYRVPGTVPISHFSIHILYINILTSPQHWPTCEGQQPVMSIYFQDEIAPQQSATFDVAHP